MKKFLSAWILLILRIRPIHVIQVWLIGCLVFLTGYCVWGLDRGFEITDEAYYFLLAMYPETVKGFVSAQHWITSGLWEITESLFGFRFIGLGILLFGALLLAMGTLHASTVCGIRFVTKSSGRIAIIASTLVGAMLYDSTINFSPCYNLLTAASCYAALGLGLLTLNRPAGWRGAVFQLCAGIALGLAMLCKPPAGVVSLILILTFTTIFGVSIFRRIIGMLLIILGMGSTVLIITLYHTTLADAIAQYRLGISLLTMVLSEPVVNRIIRYGWGFLDQLKQTGAIFYLPLLCFVVYAIFRKTLIAILGVAIMAYILVVKRYYYGGVDLYISSQATALVAILAGSLLATAPTWIRNWKAVVLMGGLFGLPYLIAFGTGNKLHAQVVVSLASWGALIGTISFAENAKGKSSIPAMLICGIFASIVTAQVVTNGFAPYHIITSMTTQSRPTNIGKLGRVKVDKRTQDFVSSLVNSAKACNIQPGRPFLGFYDMPGAAIPIQGIPIITPWIYNFSQGETVLDGVQPDNLPSIVIGIELNQDGSTPRLPKNLPNFPAGYRLCGTAVYPYANKHIQLWVTEASIAESLKATHK